MTDYETWEGKDSDFTFEQLADTIDSRLRWDAQVDVWLKEGDLEWINHLPFDPTSTETLFKENHHGY
jgi:hypothetical protein